MSKKRLYEIAKELGKESKEIVQRAKELGLDVKSHSSSVEAAAADKIVASFASVKKAVTGASDAKAKPSTEPIKTEATPSKPAKDKTEQAANKPSPSPAPLLLKGHVHKAVTLKRKGKHGRKSRRNVVNNRVNKDHKETAMIATIAGITKTIAMTVIVKIAMIAAIVRNKAINIAIKVNPNIINNASPLTKGLRLTLKREQQP